ncbi:uncharacterized protein LOC123412443 [Hordeum vulgare subsp. vulgare]|uniref:Uncharacterized protein n=1 Tax=Hordeum vulgare subsp. vulgare TaxID=112509 RepID=A0A8I6YD24_HORVV|nr:uncharacterized protein LOC123412443 [Hordeum vulgare subsp. vulgare]
MHATCISNDCSLASSCHLYAHIQSSRLVQMAAADQGKTAARRFGWLYVARWAVASVVTMLAVAVIVRAVVVMLRPEKLQLKLSGGRVAVDSIPSMPPPGNEVALNFVLRANNPSGRAFVEYTNVTVRLTDVSSASAAAPAMIAEFPLPQSIPVLQQTAHEAIVRVGMTPGEDVPMRYVQALFEGRSIDGVEMMLRGDFHSHVEMASGDYVTTSDPATYYCWPVTIAVGGSSSSSSPDYTNVVVTDAPCLDKSEAPAIV